MQFFSIGIEGRDSGMKELISRKSRTLTVDGLDIEEKKAGDIVFFNYKADRYCDCKSIKEVRDKVMRYIADLLSEIIMDDIQSQIVEKIIQDEYFYFEKPDQEKILQDALAIMWGRRGFAQDTGAMWDIWKTRVWNRIMEHLDGNSELIVEGFIRFRLKDFVKELEEAVDKAVDDLLIEKEYNEFIKLLRYFVEIQEPKVEEVHVMQDQDKKYTLLDSSLRVINNDILEDLAREISDKEISHDDLLISSLITIAPSKITIHEFDKIKNTELLNTINNVFYGKVIMSHEGITPKQ